ncbi:RNA polymerase sigma factor [Pedobacter nyackensis]|uniref:RNA polymerase sigma factor n=1 Tax=Pedobacter nyackensis TaxID=475255 RepID=UPI00292F4207|nr:sigma-70 family RNA polymerase sigma factor [Pedobacter nyackensis]
MLTTHVFDETKLVKRLRNGNIEAFNAIYWEYHEPIYRNILRIIKNEETAADILQDVFVKFWEKRESLVPEKSLGGLLFVISYNLAINHTKRVMTDFLVKGEISLVNDEGNDEFMIVEAQHELLERAVAELTIQRRLVFTGCKLEGKSYQKVAEELGISKHTVKEHLSVASKMVKEYVLAHSDSVMAAWIVLFLDNF